jgi:hypothetical protein
MTSYVIGSMCYHVGAECMFQIQSTTDFCFFYLGSATHPHMDSGPLQPPGWSQGTNQEYQKACHYNNDTPAVSGR